MVSAPPHSTPHPLAHATPLAYSTPWRTPHPDTPAHIHSDSAQAHAKPQATRDEAQPRATSSHRHLHEQVTQSNQHNTRTKASSARERNARERNTRKGQHARDNP